MVKFEKDEHGWWTYKPPHDGWYMAKTRVRLLYEVLKHRLFHWVRGDGWVD